MQPRKHLQRYREIVGVLADEGLDSVLDIAGLRRFASVRRRFRAESTPLPERIRRTLERLGATFVKLGQAASTRSDIIPDPIVEELKKLQDRVEPFPFDAVREIVEQELGAPIDELFTSFSAVPLAAASLGQVHAATLPDGTRVAVKVQRPNVREQVEVDLDIVLTQARVANTQSDPDSRYDIVSIAEEFSRALRDELDYLAEARNCERLGELFADDGTVRFPRVYWEWTTGRVLTLEMIEGIPFNRIEDLDRSGIDRARMARNGIVCYLRQIFDFGFYHADPHPGNLFAMPDGRIGFTDFGRVGTVSQVGRDQLSDLLVAIVDNDTNLAVDMLVEAAGSPGDIDVALLQRDVSHLLASYSNRPLHEIRMRDLVRHIFELVRDHHLVMSSELALLFATLAVLEGLGTQLDPQFDFVESVAPFARRIATQRNEPAALLRTLVLAMRRGGKVMTELPESLLRVMKRAGQGEFRMTVRPTGLEPLLARLERSVNRISFALVVSAILVALGLLLKDTPKPEWFLWLARLLLAGGFVVGSWFFVSIFLANYRRH